MTCADQQIAIVGQGYVGLQLAVAFGRSSTVVGFDIDQTRIDELNDDHDRYQEISSEELRGCGVTFTTNPRELIQADAFIVAVPTPVDDAKAPDLRPLLSASRTVGEIIRARGSGACQPLIVFESTVYPGCTDAVSYTHLTLPTTTYE